MNYRDNDGEAFVNDVAIAEYPIDLGGNKRRKNELFGNLSEDIAITSLDGAKELFLDRDLATINEKRSLLQALGLYINDDNVIEDKEIQDVKIDLMLALAHPVAHGLSDEDVKEAFPIVYKILFPESE